MKKRYLILSVLTLVMLLFVGNNEYAATVNLDKMSINIPDIFMKNPYISSKENYEYHTYDNGVYTKDYMEFHFNYYADYTPSIYRVEYTKDDLAKLVKNIDEYDWESDYSIYEYTVLSNSLTKISGVSTLKVRYKVVTTDKEDKSDVTVTYHEGYLIKTDTTEYEIEMSAWKLDYFNTTEYKNMINSIVIKDTVKETRVTPFTDVQTTAWYYEAVKYCYTNNYINGKNSYTFGSNDKITRGMLVTILYGMEGAPKVTATNKFSDVASNKYYYNAVRWASSKGIVNGSNGKFRPDDNVTRQDLAVILSAYCNYKGKYVKTNYGLTSFSDSSKVSSYALTAVKWAVKNKIISGTNGKLNPKGNATRAEAATMIYSFCLKFK